MCKPDEELMVKALSFIPEFQGLSMRDALRTLQLLETMLKQMQVVDIKPTTLEQVTKEWQNAASQFLSPLHDEN